MIFQVLWNKKEKDDEKIKFLYLDYDDGEQIKKCPKLPWKDLVRILNVQNVHLNNITHSKNRKQSY